MPWRLIGLWSNARWRSPLGDGADNDRNRTGRRHDAIQTESSGFEKRPVSEVRALAPAGDRQHHDIQDLGKMRLRSIGQDRLEHEEFGVARRGSPDGAQDRYGLIVRPVVQHIAQDVSVCSGKTVLEKVAAVEADPGL